MEKWVRKANWNNQDPCAGMHARCEQSRVENVLCIVWVANLCLLHHLTMCTLRGWFSCTTGTESSAYGRICTLCRFHCCANRSSRQQRKFSSYSTAESVHERCLRSSRFLWNCDKNSVCQVSDLWCISLVVAEDTEDMPFWWRHQSTEIIHHVSFGVTPFEFMEQFYSSWN